MKQFCDISTGARKKNNSVSINYWAAIVWCCTVIGDTERMDFNNVIVCKKCNKINWSTNLWSIQVIFGFTKDIISNLWRINH